MKAGDRIPEWRLPITPTLVVSTAIATRDFQDVHHDRDLAQSYGSADIFINILTTNGLVERYVTDWAGHEVEVKSIAIRLGAPAYPYDELVFTGEVETLDGTTAVIKMTGTVVTERGHNGMAHVNGKVTIDTKEAAA